MNLSYSTTLFNQPLINPLFNQERLKEVEKIIDKDPTREVAPSINTINTTQILDLGEDDYFGFGRNKILNEKGIAKIEKYVEKDAQVIACRELLLGSVAQLALTIHVSTKCPEKQELADELADFFNYVFDNMNGTIEDELRQLVGDIYGYGLSEFKWKYSDDLRFENKLVIDALKNKKQGLYQFDCDSFGNILSISNLWSPNQPLPVSKFCYSTWKKKYSNPYGCGLAETLYFLCFAKRELLKGKLKKSDKETRPTTVIYMPANPDSALIKAANKFLNDIENSTGGTLPEPLRAELLNKAANSTSTSDLDILDFLNQEISKCILGNSAEASSGNGGSYAKSKVSSQVTKVNIMYLIKHLEDIVKEQIIKPMARYNFDSNIYTSDLYPTARFGEIEEESKDSLVNRLVSLAGANFIDATDKNVREYVRKIDDIPEPENINNDEVLNV